ncbi:MAG TPA: AAA family ATPase, partial [Terriglobales bacterium]
LLAAFDRVVAQGTPELVLVSGYSGVGKSSVVNELHKVLVRQRGLFASGKFDQYQRDIPYTTLAQAFQALIRQILAKSVAEVSDWRHALQRALGTHGQLIVNLIPDVEFLIGKQPPVPDLPPQDARNRLQLVFRRFLSTFATPEHPLALFLDDLQWLDAATLDLLEHLITDPGVRYLMVVGAYRDTEVSSSHPLTRTLASICKAGARMQEIVLSPLGLDDVGWLVSDALHCERDCSQPLAELVHEKTGGNPFFAIQFLSALAEEGLLRLDPDAAAWIWDLARIRAKGYTDNAVDLMVGKLRRLSSETQSALQQLACLGNVVEFATMTLVFGKSEDEIHTALWEATRMGLILRLDGSYAFLHDRIQESAYALIPECERARAHLRIGQELLSSMTADQLTYHLFDVANQLNRGAPLLIDRDEKTHVATINLRTGRKAKAAAAYASARMHFSAGVALLDERDWDSHYELTFSLWLELAECEFLSSNIERAEQLIRGLLQRRISKIEQAGVIRLRILIHIVKAENAQAVASALECLRLFDIDLPAHPTSEQVQAEYEIVWKSLDGRPIESLLDLQLMSDPELRAAMQVLSALTPASYDSDIRLFCLVVCRMVNLSVQHGMSDASAHGFAHLGSILGPVFHRYSEALRFAKLACDLVEKHGFIAYEAKAYNSMALAAQWTRPITTAVDFLRAMFRAATETGDLTYACYAMYLSVTEFVVRNDPLDVVWDESEMALDFVQQAGFRDVADIIRSQQRFITTMQGRTATFSTFSDASFDEATFEAQLTADRLAQLVCYYWIVKLKTRFLSGDHAEALEAANKAKPLLGAAAAQIQLLDYFYYTALTVSALYENASAEEQPGWRELLTAHREQLREWAETYPPTFADKHALVSAEIARIEERAFDAMQLYEQAIQSAHEHGFVQNEALAYEVAARFYAARGFETIAHMYLRNARSCYDRWGASAKVKQLDERYPRLHPERFPASATTTIGTRVGQLDVESVVKASQALSGEIVLNELIEKLMQIAVEHAGAERGLLILLRGDEPWVEAEASTGRGRVEVAVRQRAVTPSDLPQSALQYVIRTRERVVLDDAPAGTSYSEDEYVRRKRPRSVLYLPIVKQTKLVGAVYLENSLTPCAFTTDRVAVLEMLASQAAISLENASLYSELQRSEGFLRRSEESLLEAQRLSHTGSWRRDVASGVVTLSPEIYRIFEISPDEYTSEVEFWFKQIHPEDRERVLRAVQKSAMEKTDYESDYRIVLPDGSIKYLHAVGHPIVNESGNIVEFVGTSMDVTAAKQAEEKIRQSESEFRQILEFAPQHVIVLGPDPNRTRLFVNQAALDYFGLTFEEWRDGDRSRLYHPDDWVRMLSETTSNF